MRNSNGVNTKFIVVQNRKGDYKQYTQAELLPDAYVPISFLNERQVEHKNRKTYQKLALKPFEQELVRLAINATKHSYHRKEGKSVGAAVYAENDAGERRMFDGANVYCTPNRICAETVAAMNAIKAGYEKILHVALYCKDNPGATPCGNCRQTVQNQMNLNEQNTRYLVVQNEKGDCKRYTQNQLLPDGMPPMHAPTEAVDNELPARNFDKSNDGSNLHVA
jgi:cytidine deaminase